MSSETPSGDTPPEDNAPDSAKSAFGSNDAEPAANHKPSEVQPKTPESGTPAPPLPPLGTPATPPASGSGAKPQYKPPTRPAAQTSSYTPPAQGASSAAAGESGQSPEKAIGLAFVGGFIAARLLKKLRG
jgi:hypothetical protein